MTTKKTKKTSLALGLAALMTLSIGAVPNASSSQPDCEEVLEEVLGTLGEVEHDLLNWIATNCDICELAGCPDPDVSQAAIAAMGWGSTHPGLFPDVVVITFDGCDMAGLVGDLIGFGHWECRVQLWSLVWDPGQFEADCVGYPGGLWAGELTTFGRTHHCRNVVPALLTPCSGIVAAELFLEGQMATHTSAGNGVGFARC